MAKRILVVDDDRDLCELLRILLSEAGFTVETAECAEVAIAKVEGVERFDLVITDQSMPPGMTGLEMVIVLRQRALCPPVIMVTAEHEQPKSIGITVLHKPVDIKLILTAIDRKLREPHTVASQL